ncbi:MAG TPA: class I SAM-dependent methyltransferase, partial [Candidatus Norongarragalinales archaeon]|nr:class I SAM-dependent methyltransferase [Candidatus Norongarragalinales archaeon]
MRKLDWRVKSNKRPERVFGSAQDFYGEQEAQRYAASSAMQNIQEQLALRAIELLGLPYGSKILDAGCGTGISMTTAKKVGYKVEGFDSSHAMLSVAKKHRLKVKHGDLRNIPFDDASFDGVISITALQWILSRDLERNVSKTVAEMHRVLKAKGKGAFHFLPESLVQAKKVLRLFQEAFDASLLIENPDNPRKRKV